MNALFPVLAFLGPLILALTQGITEPQWRSDAAVRAIFSGEAVIQGAPALELSRVFHWIPLGTAVARSGLLGALSLACASWAVFQLSLTLMHRTEGHSRLDAWLALAASTVTACSALWFTESLVLGGAVPGAAGALLLIHWLSRKGALPSTWAGALGGGALLGTLAAESWFAASGVVLLALAQQLSQARAGRWRDKMYLGVSLLGALLTFGLWLLPVLQKPLLWSHVTWTEGSFFPWGLTDWLSQVGVLFGLSALGVWFYHVRSGSGLLFGVGLLLVWDWFAPGTAETELFSLEANSSRLSLHLVALGLWNALAVFGFRTFAETASVWKLYGARALGALITAFALAASLASAEESIRHRGRLTLSSALHYTDESLGALPPRSLVILSTPALISRWRSAQLSAERPDVLLVPLDRLSDLSWMHRLLQEEPRLDQFIRDLNVLGAPSEHALNLLADTRPVFVEPHPEWDRRLLEHLVPLPLIPRFSPHALGRSDREQGWATGLPSLLALQQELREAAVLDRATASVLDGQLEKLATCVQRAGDKKTAELIAGSRVSEETIR